MIDNYVRKLFTAFAGDQEIRDLLVGTGQQRHRRGARFFEHIQGGGNFQPRRSEGGEEFVAALQARLPADHAGATGMHPAMTSLAPPGPAIFSQSTLPTKEKLTWPFASQSTVSVASGA